VDHETSTEESDSETNDEDDLIATQPKEEEATRDTEDSESDGLTLDEVGRVLEGPGLDDDDEGVEVGVGDVERDL